MESLPNACNSRAVRKSLEVPGVDGGRTRTRTWDPLIKSQLLYQLSYAPGSPWAGTRARRRRVAKQAPGCPANGPAAQAKAPGEPGGSGVQQSAGRNDCCRLGGP